VNIVKSQEKNDCGICALACATGRPWHEVKAAIWAGRVARRLAAKKMFANSSIHDHDSCATTGKDLIDAANRLGYEAVTRCRPCPMGVWPYVPTTAVRTCFAVVKVQYQNRRMSHWIVYDGTLVYDNGDPVPEPLWVAGKTSGYALAPLSYILFMKNP